MTTNTLAEPKFAALLDRLYAEADASQQRLRDWIAGLSPDELAAWKAGADDYRSLYLNAKDAHLAVSRPIARLLYILARTRHARTVVEFGTSFGLSTLHLAAAVHDNGGGLLIGSEFEPGKVAQARQNLAEAGLADGTDIRDGDALDTLAHDLPGAIDLVFLDGAKQLYLPVLALLEGHLPVGALLIADDTGHAPDYLEHVRNSGMYESTVLESGIELSVRTS
ncbi:O-methyltransferase [Streptacidiphilus sp. P02-A3a]|uniref:O-methyltransferase n=1 Tax=Streptacidiphilus sp. P02-A3a TaxID=2704468 RepID=UPI0015F9FD70|nr:class I SAM-dependent methyltransferase [Streptacidiphilus sp. P02-A3a]QMU69643.1 O-methyltransferase [Streptacidiphilus sp. P02-A3a]